LVREIDYESNDKLSVKSDLRDSIYFAMIELLLCSGALIWMVTVILAKKRRRVCHRKLIKRMCYVSKQIIAPNRVHRCHGGIRRKS